MTNYASSGPFTADPTVNEDATAGFAVGFHYYNDSTAQEFVCHSNAVGAAVWYPVNGNSVSTGLVATGTVQTDALALVSSINVLATVAASTGVRLPLSPTKGHRCVVKNRGANTANIFPGTGGTINAGSANAAVTLAAAAVTELVHLGSNAWEAI